MSVEQWRRLAQETQTWADRATPGPWKSDRVENEVYRVTKDGVHTVIRPAPHTTSADVQFIAAARTCVPVLAAALLEACDEVERLRAKHPAAVAGVREVAR